MDNIWKTKSFKNLKEFWLPFRNGKVNKMLSRDCMSPNIFYLDRFYTIESCSHDLKPSWEKNSSVAGLHLMGI